MKREWNPLEAKIRSSEALASLPDDACRTFYLLCYAQLDSYGRISSRRAVLNAEVWPLLGKTLAETERCFEECVKVGLFDVYQDGEKVWAQAPEWESGPGPGAHPNRRGKSDFPEPSVDKLRTKDGHSPLARARIGQDKTGQDSARTEPRVRATPQGDHPEAVRWWEAEWLRTRGTVCALQTKDFVALAKALKLKGSSISEVKARITRLLESTDRYLAENAEPALVLSKWNNLAVTNGRHHAEVPLFDAEAQRKRREG